MTLVEEARRLLAQGYPLEAEDMIARLANRLERAEELIEVVMRDEEDIRSQYESYHFEHDPEHHDVGGEA